MAEIKLRAQRGTAGDAGVCTVARNGNRNFVCVGIDGECGDTLTDVSEERLVESGGATSDHDNFRVQNVNHVAEPEREHFCAVGQYFVGEDIVRSEALGDSLSSD